MATVAKVPKIVHLRIEIIIFGSYSCQVSDFMQKRTIGLFAHRSTIFESCVKLWYWRWKSNSLDKVTSHGRILSRRI